MSLLCQSRWENFIQALSSPLSFRVWNSKQWLGCWGCGSLLSCLHSEWLSPERAAAQEPSAWLVPPPGQGRPLQGLRLWPMTGGHRQVSSNESACYRAISHLCAGDLDARLQGQGGVSTVSEHQGTREQLCSAPARTNNYSGLQVHQGGTRHSTLASDWSNEGPGGVWLVGAGVVWTEAQVQASSGELRSSGPGRHGHSHVTLAWSQNPNNALLNIFSRQRSLWTLYRHNTSSYCSSEVLITEVNLLSLSLGWENSMGTDFK